MHPSPEYDDATENFLARVQQHAGVTTRIEAERLARATLHALGERISSGQAADLAPGIPPELRPEIEPERARGQAKAFEKNAFLDRITGQIGTVDIEVAERQARGLLRTLYEWAPEGEIDATLAQLPPELAELFE